MELGDFDNRRDTPPSHHAIATIRQQLFRNRRLVKLAPIWTTDTPLETGDPKVLEVRWERWLSAAGSEADPVLQAFIRDVHDDPAKRALLGAAFGHNPFFANCLIADPPFARQLIEGGPDQAFAEVCDAAQDSRGLGVESNTRRGESPSFGYR